jgi:LysR family transcriptional activator of nhaA
MEWLNYHHLLYFWSVAREGSLAKAAASLRLSHPTVSAQIHRLEDSLGEKLFRKQGRRLVLTETGQIVFQYADEIFSLGRELMETVRGRPTGRPVRLKVGVADVMPKLVARRLLDPATKMADPVRLICFEDTSERLLARLALHELDVILSDSPVGPQPTVKAFNHLLGECAVSWFGVPKLASRYRENFPQSLNQAPVLLPTENTALRRSLEQWFSAHQVRPKVVAEFEDSALMTTFGQDGMGLFPSHAAVEREVMQVHSVALVARVEEVREQFFAISVERRLTHPAVLAMTRTARNDLFKGQ